MLWLLNMCLFQRDLLEYAVHLQQISTHAHWVIKGGVVIDIIPDFIDLTGHGVSIKVRSINTAGLINGYSRPNHRLQSDGMYNYHRI